MKIAVVSNLYPPFCIGGYERLCGEVSSALTAMGHDIVVLTSDYGGGWADVPGQIVERSLRLLANYDDIYQPPALDESDRRHMADSNRAHAESFVERHRPDVVFAWNLYFLDASFLDGLASRCPKVVLFLTDNWLIAAQKPERIGDFFTRFVHGRESFADGPAKARASGGTEISARALFGARFVKDLYQFCGFDTPNSAIIHNGVNLPMVPAKAAIDRALLRSSGRLKLLFAGRVVDVKGTHLLIDALPAIRRGLPPDMTLSVSIVGDMQDKGYRHRIEEQILQSGCSDIVRFHEPVKEAALPSLFNDHDIYIFPSLYEPFSLTLIHALAAGIPTVASDVGGNIEIVEHGRTGLVFDHRDPQRLAEAVLLLGQQPALRVRLAETARHVAQRFTFRRMVNRIEQDLVSYVRS